MKNFKAVFYKVEKELDDKGKEIGRKYSYLGSVIIDDSNVDNTNLTLIGKAYRHGGSVNLLADKVTLEEIKL